jgi:outer membrane protein OmpA-like peptidoglycan-associated protein/tetratricopeptide (TPR) repeat protein
MPVKILKFPTFVLFTLLLCISLSYAAKASLNNFDKKKPKGSIKSALEFYLKGDIDEAENIIIKSFKKDTTDVNAYLLLSDIYADRKDEEKQIWALNKILSIDSVNYKVTYKLLGNLYFKKGNYNDALNKYESYNNVKTHKDSLFIENRIKSCRFALNSISENKDIKVIPLNKNVNTTMNEYWPAISTDDSILYFTRLIDENINFPYERLFYSKKESEGWSEASLMDFNSEDGANIGTMCISADDKLMFFTMCGNKGGKGSCDIYYSRKVKGYWSNPVNAGGVINGKSWDSQPSVSADNRFLYFASSRSGGFGGMDIWRSEFKEMKDGSLFFQAPQNLGPGVNSSLNDFSPYIHSDGITLYFASEGKYGFGGSDLFMSRLNDTVWSSALNFGYPVNTRYNEDGIVISPSGFTALFSSDRDTAEKRSKDLFQFDIPEEFMPDKVGYIKGFVVDNSSKNKLNAIIEISRLDDGESVKVTSDNFDGFSTTLVASRRYALNVNLKGYRFYSRHFDLSDSSSFKKAMKLMIYLDPVNTGDLIELSNIFFDFNSANLKAESYPELNQIVLFLESNSSLKVEISGHTDNVGTDEYNLKLSEQRAKSIYDYLITRVNKDRLTYKGYGSSSPVTSNATDEGRAQNRRCELKIL